MAVECAVIGCGQQRRKREWCASHYNQWRRTGRPPTPFIYKWATEKRCTVCGVSHDHKKLRRYCSYRCAQRAHRGEVASTASCQRCGQTIGMDLATRRKRRADVMMCDSCRGARSRRHKFPVRVLALRDGEVCGLCERPVDLGLKHPDAFSPSVDHIIPRAHGGSDDPSNLQLAHLTCNQNKHARLAPDTPPEGRGEVSRGR